ncbi:MAG TPA: hypothetical protein VMV07_08795 [Streptosporangiaceae bacterium]|nr:hypothetical protein [Streptosporangiaceae bacterium]
MSSAARTASAGSPAAAAGGGRPAGSADAAGRLLGRLTVLPALLMLAWLLAGLPLLLLGLFTPVLTLVISVPLAALLVVVGLRWIPGRALGLTSARRPGSAATSWWAVAALVAVAVAFGVDQMIYHSEQLIVTRDPASYIQFGNWIARHGSLPIPQDAAAFGGVQGLHFYSSAFYRVGDGLVPQFMAGLPMILAGGFWAGGVGAAVAMAPLLGACAVLTFGGLVARLVGPRWAPLGGLVLALALPEQFTSRSTYSEPAAQILFLGGLCLVIDSLAADGVRPRVTGVTAALGGLALGVTLLVRIDAASDMLPLIPYCGLLLVGRRPQALPLLAGAVAGASYGVVDGVVLSRPYLASISSSLIPLILAAVTVLAATGVAVALWWRRGLPQVRGAWLPNVVTGLAFAVMTGFFVRPWVQTVHGRLTPLDLRVMAAFQRADHLPVDPSRVYYEISLRWVFWYIGVPAVVLGTLGAALLARRCLRGRAPAWTLPLMTFAWIIVLTLYRPAITPDQPWASRRLVPAVLPGFILLASWASAWLLDWLRRRGWRRGAVGGVAAFLAAALVLPAASTTFGLTHRDGGPLGVEPAAVGLAAKATYRGEIAAVNGLCAAIPRNASVVIVNAGTANRLAQVVRGMCGVPVARLGHPPLAAEEVVANGIRRAGRRPVLLASGPEQLIRFGGPMRQVMDLRSTGDEHPLTTPPMNTRKIRFNVWMSEPPR